MLILTGPGPGSMVLKASLEHGRAALPAEPNEASQERIYEQDEKHDHANYHRSCESGPMKQDAP